MNPRSAQSGLQFLSVAEAADRLGMSRIKIRDAAARGLIPSQRDNENRLRLDISDVGKGDLSGGKVDQAALMNLLFDEVEELSDDMHARLAEIDALRSIADRQADALDKAASQIEQDAADKARLSDLLERALAHLEGREGNDDNARLADVSGRALNALEATEDRLESSLSQNARFDALLERALEYAAAGKAAGETEAKAMGETADRALAMLDDVIGGAEKSHNATNRALQMLDVAIRDAEQSQQAVARTGDMLDRALQAGERLEGEIAERDRKIETKTATVEKVLEMSERAVALAGSNDASPRKRSFWQWLIGR
ncbi:MAG: hypothetical protein ABJN03_20190 [Ascidiaceihabitans sp.]|uniref:hypothetical protein n=1 Tax=Rhodobacterales TaxID=204455 RepID=UPI0032986156